MLLNCKPLYTLIITGLTLSLVTPSKALAQTGFPPNKETDLQIGVVQRFGEKSQETITLKPTSGDRLIFRFTDTTGLKRTLTASSIQLQAPPQPLPSPALDEKLVLGTYRSFESAENTANQWRAQGIIVEIAQPQRWQVWAKRDIYSTPLLRRRLLQSLQAKGNKTAYLETKILQQLPALTATIGTQRYQLETGEIETNSRLIQVIQTPSPPKPANNKTTTETPKPRTSLYRGNLRLQPNSYGTYTLVNIVPIETYLRGVVPHEIGGEAPYASIEAQAILARTYALRNLHRYAADNYQLCANTNCQVYKGLTDTWEKADQAIAATTGQVLTYEKELIDALYYAVSGGITASFEDIWEGEKRAYLVPVLDSLEQTWPLNTNSLALEENFRRFIQLKKGFNEDEQELFRWREESTLATMNKDLRRYLEEKQNPLSNFGTITQLTVSQRSASGRVLKMRVDTDIGSIELEKDEILRGFYAPLSTLFYVEPVYLADKKTLKGYAFIGGGFGHGVGMSQTGSYHLAKKGWSSQQILNFYYPGTTVKQSTVN